MDDDIFDGILAEFGSALDAPSPAETAVNPEAVRKRAADMAAQGYLPTRASLLALEKYLQGYGLWLTGGVGTGKTAFFRHLAPPSIRLRSTGRPPSIAILPLVRTVEMGVDDVRSWLDEHNLDEVVLDDVGAEPVFNHFGGKFEILPYILDKRLGSPCRTHATSNLSAKALADRYRDARVIDRFAEMFARIDFGGPSLRRSRPNALIRSAQEAALRRSGGGNGARVAATPAESARTIQKRPVGASRGVGSVNRGGDAPSA